MVLYSFRRSLPRVFKRAAIGLAVLLVALVVVLSLPPTVAPAGQLLALASGGTYEGAQGMRFQKSAVDCGVAALEMVFIEQHVDPRLLEPARAMVIARDSGLTMLEMSEIAAKHGLVAEGRRMNLAALEHAPLPVVGSFPGHWVVIDRVTPDGYVDIRDPEIGRVRMTSRRFLQRWTGKVLLVGRTT
jgi:hypothetical protein